MVDLDSPPAEPVRWSIQFRPELGYGAYFVEHDGKPAVVMAIGCGQTAWLAYLDAREGRPAMPPFGSCVVERVGGGK